MPNCALCGSPHVRLHPKLYIVTVKGTLHFCTRAHRDDYESTQWQRERKKSFVDWLFRPPPRLAR